MTSVPSVAELIHPGDRHLGEEIVVAVLRPGQEILVVDRIPSDEESVRRLIASPTGGCYRPGYKTGPGGYELPWLLASMGVFESCCL